MSPFMALPRSRIFIVMTEISVIITTHNRHALLPRAVESVRQQSLQPTEIIVVDDGSTDATSAWLEQQNDIRTLSHAQPRGISSARNTGIAAASGTWLALLDDDDTWLTHKLEKQVHAIEESPEFRLCHSDEIWVRNGKRVNAMNKHRKYGGWIYPHCLPLCVISPSAVMIRRDLFTDTGLFDTELPACEDYDLWLRICAHEPVLYVEQPLITKYGGHADQLSRQYWGMDRFRIRALEKMLASKSLSIEYRLLTLETLIHKSAIYIKGAEKRGKHDEVHNYQARLQDYQRQLAELQPRQQYSC
jgi:glycosyltransferase involved in cell wall biosynthesis